MSVSANKINSEIFNAEKGCHELNYDNKNLIQQHNTDDIWNSYKTQMCFLQSKSPLAVKPCFTKPRPLFYWKMDLIRGLAEALRPTWGLVALRNVWLRKDWLRETPLGLEPAGAAFEVAGPSPVLKPGSSCEGAYRCLRCWKLLWFVLVLEACAELLRYCAGLRPLWSRTFGSAPGKFVAITHLGFMLWNIVLLKNIVCI